MDYDAQGCPPSGELLLRGPVIFQGYFRNPTETKSAFDEEGWYAFVFTFFLVCVCVSVSVVYAFSRFF